MSDAGKLIRGKEYYNKRDVNGNYPENFLDNDSVKTDLDFYIASLPKPEVKEEPIKKKEKK